VPTCYGRIPDLFPLLVPKIIEEKDTMIYEEGCADSMFDVPNGFDVQVMALASDHPRSL